MKYVCIKCGKEEAVLAETEEGLLCGDCNKENHRKFLEEMPYFTPTMPILSWVGCVTTVSG